MQEPGIGAQARRDLVVDGKAHWFAPRKPLSLGVPTWYLRLQLRGLGQEIERLETALAGEFALDETQPVLDDLVQLGRERDVVLKRLEAAR